MAFTGPFPEPTALIVSPLALIVTVALDVTVASSPPWTLVVQSSSSKNWGRFPFSSSSKRSSNDASAASKVKPLDSISFTRATTRVTTSLSSPRSTPSSRDFNSMDARPAISDTNIRISFPTVAGSSC